MQRILFKDITFLFILIIMCKKNSTFAKLNNN